MSVRKSTGIHGLFLILLIPWPISGHCEPDQVPDILTINADRPARSFQPGQNMVMMGIGPARPWQMVVSQMPDDERATYFSAPVGSYGPGHEAGSGQRSEDLRIRLQQAQFDPLRTTPNLPSRLTGATRGGSGSDYYLVQFHGPIRPQWRDLITDHGGEILDYVPDFAFIVRLAAGRSAGLAARQEVRWVGSFLPAYRLSAELIPAALRASQESTYEILARGFVGEPVEGLAKALEDAGIEILERHDDSGGGPLFKMRVSEATLMALAEMRGIAWVEQALPLALGNAVARGNDLVGKDLIEQSLGLYGQGQIVTVVDTGLSTGDAGTMHQDFAGRLAGWGTGPGANCSGWADNDAHGTHVAGSVLGSGVRSGANVAANQYSGTHAGIAPLARLIVWAGCNDLTGIPTTSIYSDMWSLVYNVDPQSRVANNSWGQIDPQTFGTYNIVARETDRFIRDFPDFVGVFITQNSGRDNDLDGVADMGTVTPPGTAKNVISVGASENLRSGGGFNPGGACADWDACFPGLFTAEPIKSDRLSNHADGMAAFSGRGPTFSNRLKPDIVAPGTNIISARNESNGIGWGVEDDFHIYMGGTSMAAPLVSGGAAVVREFFQTTFGHDPSAALVKATLINSARDMSPGQYGTGGQQDVWRRPDVNQGWGRMDLPATLIFNGVRRPAYFEVVTGLGTGQFAEQQITLATGGNELRVTLVWTDVHGLEATHGALVNDLDLEVVDPNGTTHFGFAGMVGQQVDRFNNFEEVRLESAPAGNYTLRVIGFNVPEGPQSFAVVLTGALPGDSVFRDRFQQ
jgi:hypothetical protein